MTNFDTKTLFTAALMLPEPWYIDQVDFREEPGKARTLHIFIKFRQDARFQDPAAAGGAKASPVHDTLPGTWRNTNFFQYPCLIHCDVPRILGSDGRIRQDSAGCGSLGTSGERFQAALSG